MDTLPPVLNPTRIQETTGGDPEFLRELMDLYLEDAQERLRELHAALEAADAEAVARCAHKMKGASSNVGAERIERLAIRIEQDAHRGVLPALPETLSSLRSELEQIPRALEASTS